MVILGKGREREDEEEEGAEKSMDMWPERSKPLHNFTMPCLKWGKQRFLRCMKLNSNGEVSAADRRSPAFEMEKVLIEPDFGKRRSIDRMDCLTKPPVAGVGGHGKKLKVDGLGDDGIEAVRTKLMLDLQTAAAKMKVAILRDDLEEEEPPARVAAPAEAEVARPWNLRTRRAACKEPNGGTSNGGGGKSLKVDERKPNFSPARTESKSPRLRGVSPADTATPIGETRERAKFSVPLSRREIEEDFMAMMGHRPPRRPKKRAKIVQRQLDSLFPGLWLTEVTADCYKVPDTSENGKR